MNPRQPHTVDDSAMLPGTATRALVVVNPRSRSGKEDLGPALEVLRARGVEVELHESTSIEAANQLIRSAKGRKDLVVVGGGDGTLHGLIEAVMDVDLPLGILPLGTANDLARTLGLPLTLPEAAEALAAGHPYRIDLGRVNGRFFFNAASIGLGAVVNQRLNKHIKGRWGVLSYARNLAQALRASRPFTAELICDGRPHRVRSLQITVGNGRHYGGGMTVHADAAIDDQRLDVYSVPPQSPWRLVGLLPSLRQGLQGAHEAVHVLHGRRLEVRTRRPRTVTADGEPVSRTPALFEVVPAALPVIVGQLETEGLRHASQ